MKTFRLSFLGAILIGCIFTIILLSTQKLSTPYVATLSPLFQELGKPLKSIDRALSKILPIDEIDEKALGEAIKSQFDRYYLKEQEQSETVGYLNALMKELTQDSKKPFDYTVYLIPGAPNAFALPGGVICITDGLMQSLKTEGELVAILGHEIGHIEMGHCFDLHREEMLRKKIKILSILTYATEVLHSVAKISFSKSQENASDNYGFHLLIKHGYSPFSLASAFKHLIELKEGPSSPNFIDDFLHSHPYLEIRKEQFQAKAVKWRHKNPEVKTYLGTRNLEQKTTYQQVVFPEEYTPSH